MGENELAAKVVEHEEGQFGGHPFTQARIAIVEAIAILAQREELAEIGNPWTDYPRRAPTMATAIVTGSAPRLCQRCRVPF
jgi:hypothetical protein